MFEPDWPAPPGVRALCTTREGGVSAAPFNSFNLGDHVGDDPAAVQANRAALAQAIGTRPVFLRQVHGTQVAHLDADTSDGTEADACISTRPGVACTIMVADCLPVLLAHRSGRVVAAAHAGWRGLADGVLETVFERFWPLAQAEQALAATETIAWLGPCIGPQAFEVGPEVRAAFCDCDAGAAACFVAIGGGKYLADLAGLARLRLARLGVTVIYGNDGSAPWCTVGNAARFFSHRRDTRALGGSGRFAACVWLAS
jgi:YfiH family protein